MSWLQNESVIKRNSTVKSSIMAQTWNLTHRSRLWQALAFVPLLMTSSLTKLGITMYLYSSSSGGKDLCNDIEIRVIGSVRPEICTKCSEIRVRNRVQAKFPLTTLGYSMPLSIVDSREFLKCKQAQKKVNHCIKKIRKEERSLKTYSRSRSLPRLKLLISAHARAKMS